MLSNIQLSSLEAYEVLHRMKMQVFLQVNAFYMVFLRLKVVSELRPFSFVNLKIVELR